MRLPAVQSMANDAIHLAADQMLSFEPISLAATGDRGVPGDCVSTAIRCEKSCMESVVIL